jgi:hypothetical protein
MVRWAPDELSFSSAEAWKDIYTPHKPGETFVKDPGFYIIDDTYVFYFDFREYINPFFSSLRAKMIANISDPEEHKQARKMLASV